MVMKTSTRKWETSENALVYESLWVNVFLAFSYMKPTGSPWWIVFLFSFAYYSEILKTEAKFARAFCKALSTKRYKAWFVRKFVANPTHLSSINTSDWVSTSNLKCQCSEELVLKLNFPNLVPVKLFVLIRLLEAVWKGPMLYQSVHRSP